MYPTPTIKWALIPYHIVVLVVFASIYAMIGMKQHFGVADATPVMPVYFAMVTHSTTGFGDLAPKTDLARMVVVLHLCFAWIPTIVLAVS